ncbi:MAG: SDR family NAD(P)-dependent oxidoreductase [Longimonas sp.]|uniref:SDR family NAD(P)-dependent oxidoreductase n=1 Tax=Longimonas sp. TaxID=2039626 RepID=UPI003974ADD6
MRSSPTVWITGASSGIGKALAHAWSQRGARLLLSARRREALDAVREQCAHPERHRVLPLDLADPASLHTAVDEATAAHDTIDVLMNNGGISQRGTAQETQLSVVRRIMEVNFFGAVTLICPGYVRTNVSHNALTEDGSPCGAMSASIRNGIDPGDCATAIIRAMHEERDEVYIGGVETYAVYLKRLYPALFNRLIRIIDTT